jgi:hypothetical protein
VAATTTVSCSIESPNKEIYKIEYKGGLEWLGIQMKCK